MFKPKGKNLSAYLQGIDCRKKNVPFNKNPLRFGKNFVLSAWWEKGWIEQDRRENNES